MKFIYKINPNVGINELEIEADSYELKDDYFNFYEGFNSGGRTKVASVAASVVSEIRREAKS